MKNILKNFSLNWKSGLTVSLISIPLSVSLAVASGATPIMGIVTGIWAGFVASLLGGSHYNIVGPTGALSGILAAYALTHGIGSLPMLAIVSGIMILLAYFLKFEKYLKYIPASTVQGFTLGVAFIIALNQLNSALGISGLETHERFIENVFETFSHLNLISIPSLSVFAVFLGALFLFQKKLPKLPGAIVLAPVGILLGYLSVKSIIPISILTLGAKFSDITPTLFLPIDLNLSTAVIVPAITVAVVAILETMISAKIADGMTQTKHHKRKELFALGVSNIISGFAGGMPATAALARTSLNIKSGATNKLSATINSIFIVIISFIFLTYFKYIPMAVIAAILVFVAIRMVEMHHLIRMFHLDKKSFTLAMAVAVITIVEDPIIGLLAGATAALLLFIDTLSKGQFDLMINEKGGKKVKSTSEEDFSRKLKKSHTLVYTIKGSLVYINGESHLSRFENGLNGSQNIIIRLRELYFIDLDGIDILDEIIESIESRGRKVYITGTNKLIEEMLLNESDYYGRLKKEKKVFEKTSDVLRELGFKV
ncbi:SulP family inorganic anion transporter [Candidatus Dojkabacteria bacterium]|nr:SulP family inorganic anion transporter [Candidatus Dojkabacteria bacterium]